MHVQWECQINQWVYQLWVYGITYRFSLIPCVSHPKHEWNLFWDVNNSLFGGGYPPSRGLTPRNEVLGKCRRRFPHVDHALVEFLHTKSWYLWMLPFIPPDFSGESREFSSRFQWLVSSRPCAASSSPSTGKSVATISSFLGVLGRKE